MKFRLFFIIFVLFLAACAKKINSSNNASYYKEEIEKSTRLLAGAGDDQDDKATAPLKSEPAAATVLTATEKTKFAKLLEVGENELQNEKLYDIINDWLGTPYYWGGTTKSGIDCSAYVQDVFKKAYEIKLPRTSNEQFYFDIKAHFKGQKYLKQGDLLFFRLQLDDTVVSHVGIYLQNGKFTGSNSPNGVEIADLNTPYWQSRFVSGARLLKNQYQ